LTVLLSVKKNSHCLRGRLFFFI